MKILDFDLEGNHFIIEADVSVSYTHLLTEKEATAVTNSVELDLCGYLEPETEALLSSALERCV